MSKTEYAYTVGEVGTAIKTYNYAYLNAWKDQLTTFDGQSIVYDAAGNPTSYLGNTLTWSKGRLLTKYVNGSTTVDMQYNAKGLRATKVKTSTYSNASSSYTYDSNGKLRTEIAGSFTRRYFYGADGIIGYEENGERFMYRKNLFGDITAIYQGATKIAEYSYDAWGNCKVTFDTNGYGTRNPIRYRGYYFDNDLNMYYLTTRYYDPKIGRFINADTPKYLEPKTINGLNLYAYCCNNPIMHIDPMGTFLYTCWGEDGGYDLDEEIFKYLGGGGGGYGYTNYGKSLESGTAQDHGYIPTPEVIPRETPQFEKWKYRFFEERTEYFIEKILEIIDRITEGAPGYATDVYLLPEATFSSGTGPGAAGARHAGDLIFSRFFGEDYVMDHID